MKIMKRLSLLLFLGAIIIISGCSKDDSIDQDQTNLQDPTLKAEKIYFDGLCLPTLEPIVCGESHELPNGMVKVTGFQSVWQDVTGDELTTGYTYWDEDMLFSKDRKSAKVWGKAILVLDDERGEWHFSMQGSWVIKEGSDDLLAPICDLPPPPAPLPSSIITGVCKAVGKSGEVKGMVGEWTYVMDTDAGFFYVITGWYR